MTMEEIASHIPAREIKPILDTHFEDPFWSTLHQKTNGGKW
jgi:hypothetical protein